MSWNAYITGPRTKYRPNDTIPITTSLTANAVKGQFACWQIPLKIDGEDISTINATCTTPTKGTDTLGVPLIYKAYLHNIFIPSRRANWGGLGTNLGNPIGEIPDALVPKVDAFYSEPRNAFPFSINRISPVYEFPVMDMAVPYSTIKTANTARIIPTIGGTGYSGTGLKNYHIVMEDATKFRWTNTALNIKVATWNVTEEGDTNGYLSSWSFTGSSLTNTNGGLLYWNFIGATKTVNIYKDASKTQLVASGSRTGVGSIVLAQQNASGLTGSVYVAGTTPNDDTDAANILRLRAAITTYQNHGFSAGDPVRIKTSRSLFNGSFTIASVPAPTATTFYYLLTGLPGLIYYDGGGTVIKTWNATGVTKGSDIALDNGLTITFPVQTYAVGDEWEFYVNTSRVETLWMESYIPTNAVAGTYTSTITISANGKSNITLDLTVVVYNVAIGKEPTIPIQYNGSVGGEDCIIRGHFETGFDSGSPNAIHLALLYRYQESALRHRMSLPTVGPYAYWSGTTVTNWDSVIKPFLSRYLDGTWIQGVEPTGMKWSMFQPRSIGADWFGVQDRLDKIVYTQLEQDRIVAMKDLLVTGNGIQNWMTVHKPYVGIMDEPYYYTDGTSNGPYPVWGAAGKWLTAATNASTYLKSVSSNFRILMTRNLIPGWVGLIDVWDSNILSVGAGGYPIIDSPRYIYDSEIAAGRQFWWYQGCDSKSCWAVGADGYDSEKIWGIDYNTTVNIDSPMTDLIGYHWLMYDNDVRGDLYYTVVEALSGYGYYPGMAQQDMWDVSLNYGRNGEDTIFSPGRVGNTKPHYISDTGTDIPIESLRLKAWRIGQEDYEIFKLAMGGNNDSTPYGAATTTTTTTNTSLTDTKLLMATNKYVGATITCYGKTLVVTSNTATTFTGASWSGGGNPGNAHAWYVNAINPICINIENAVGAGKWRYYSPSPAIYGVTDVTEANMDTARTNILNDMITAAGIVYPAILLSGSGSLSIGTGGSIKIFNQV